MEPLTYYIKNCKALDEAEFTVKNPFPFLIHDSSNRTLRPVEMTRGLTMDRMVLEGQDGEGGRDAWYSVFSVAPRSGDSLEVSVGCSQTCDVQINDDSVSKLHAVIAQAGSGFSLRDNDSTAGTFVNDEAVSGPARVLIAGDRVTFGAVDLIFLPAPDFHRFVRAFFALETT